VRHQGHALTRNPEPYGLAHPTVGRPAPDG